MSQHHVSTKPRHFTLSACAVAIAAAVMVATPGAYAREPAKNDSPSIPAGQMDHSKMHGMKHMKGMSMTGDADFDFATNMRKHHQMALPMAQAELKNGKDPQMLQSAKDIIDGQTKEIAAFDQWLAAHKPAMDQPMTKGK
jgi:uncharacterized protein (DUF305 family)